MPHSTIPIKKELLDLLRQSDGWVSGQSISSRLQVSRSAIWKHIGKLRKEGYLIQSLPKLGYRLLKSPENPLPLEIQQGLTTKIFGKTELIYLAETDSTNKVAKDLANQNAPEGTVVIAEKQTQGRGRLGRQWFSPAADGIYVSLVLRPPLLPQEAPKLTLMTAVAAAEAVISLTGLPAQIKWPNDILINGKKAAGILTEINAEMDVINHIVIGLGLNVNTPVFPDEIKETATSLFLEKGTRISRIKWLQEYLQHFEKYYEVFLKNGFGPILQRWKALTNIIGREIHIAILNEQYHGIVQDIDQDGTLIIKDRHGLTHRIICGDVTVLKEPVMTQVNRL